MTALATTIAIPAKAHGGLCSSWARLDEAEYRARIRSLATTLRLIAGPRHPALDLLALAEGDRGLLARADALLQQTPPLIYRRVLASWLAAQPGSQ